MEISKPIFIVGTGRNGSTILYRLFTEHPKAAWISGVLDHYPGNPGLNNSLRAARGWHLLGSVLRPRLNPSEGYNYWETLHPGFRNTCRDLNSEDVTPKTRDKIIQSLPKLLTTKRNRLVMKLTGWPRMGFLSEIYPDAKFIHILRDGRAVANSFLNVDWWTGWRGPQCWRWGELTPQHKEEWVRYQKSYIVLAAIEWKLLMAAFEKAKMGVSPQNYFEIHYEKLCSNRLEVLKGLMVFCELEWSRKFETAVKGYTLVNANNKWKHDLSEGQQAAIEAVLRYELAKYGFARSDDPLDG